MNIHEKIIELRDFITTINKNIPNITVIGDYILDIDILGQTKRLCPEGPVLDFYPTQTICRPGGAANVAEILHHLHTNPTLITPIPPIASQIPYATTHLATPGCAAKIRYIEQSNNQLLFRSNIEPQNQLPTDTMQKLIEKIKENISQNPNAIIISDYNKGTCTPEIIQSISQHAHPKNIPILLDTKPQNLIHYSNITAITPNQNEWNTMTTLYGEKQIFKHTQYAIITHGPHGITIKSENFIEKLPPIPLHYPPTCTIGAGDAFIAALTHTITCNPKNINNHTITNSAYLAQIIASLYTTTYRKPTTWNDAYNHTFYIQNYYPKNILPIGEQLI